MSNKIEPTVGASKESTGFLGGLFGGKKGVRSVSDILGAFTAAVDELKVAIEHHKQKKADNQVEIERLSAESDASEAEIVGANHAITNITALISPAPKAE